MPEGAAREVAVRGEHATRPPGGTTVWAFAVGVLMVVVGWTLAVAPASVRVVSTPAGATLAAQPPARIMPASPVPPARPAAAATVGAPVALMVDDLALTTSIVPVLADANGALALPADPAVLGWWAPGAPVGAPTGSTVLAAHVDSAERGAGPMADLIRAPLGTVLTVTDAAGTPHAFALTQRWAVPKSELPAELFALDGPHRLVLITCGGPFDEATGHYRDNVVLVAQPV